MLTKWLLSGFKSKLDGKSLDLAPLTVFTGTNSSGKSTILHSILLLKQTCDDLAAGKNLILNGPLVKLGSFADVTSGKSFLIGFQNHDGTSVMAEFEKSASENETPIFFPVIRKLVIKDLRNVAHAEIIRENSPESLLAKKDASHPEVDVDNFRHILNQVSIKNSLSTGGGVKKYSDLAIGVRLAGFIPNDFFEIIPTMDLFCSHYLQDLDFIDLSAAKKKQILDEIATAYNAKFKESNPDPAFEAAIEIAYKALAAGEDLIFQVLDENSLLKSEELAATINDTISEYFKKKVVGSRLDRSFAPSNSVRKLCDASNSPNWQAVSPLLESKRLMYSDIARIRFLGPLRERPMSVYHETSVGGAGDIGTKGEYVAQVIGLHRDKQLQIIPPNIFESLEFSRPKYETRTLQQAVSEWLAHLGVAQSVDSTPVEGPGYKLEIVSQEGSIKSSMANVGVGVSQVLPIIVLSLLSEKGDILIFEQPELHLHPKTQSRLADFFFAMILGGRQCLVETHSEHIINRLRYLAAAYPGKDEDNPIVKNVLLYFVEKKECGSEYMPIKIDGYGSLPEWPAGFFDEGILTLQVILAAAAKKRDSK